MKIIKNLSILLIFFACLTSLTFAAGENDQTKINKFKTDVAAIGLDAAITAALQQGLDVSAIASAAISMGQTAETVTQGVLSAARTLNIDMNAAIFGLSQAGVTPGVIAQASGNSIAQINSIIASAGQNPGNNPQGQTDQGLGFGNDPALGGQGANPANPPGNSGQIGGGSLGGGGQRPVSPATPGGPNGPAIPARP